MRSYAILIDGGFAKHKLGNSRSRMNADTVHRFIATLRMQPALSTLTLHRVYFYDAEPSSETVKKPLNGGTIEFSKTSQYSQSQKLFTELVKLPFMALRKGEVAINGWSLDKNSLQSEQETVSITHNDLKPSITQKGVDMKIGLDIASLALKKQVQVIVLVTGDSDFVPAMKFARKEGAQLFLVPLKHGIKESMHEHADLIIDIDPKDFIVHPNQPKTA